MNSSSLLARATDFSIGRSSSRPKATIAITPIAAGAKASSSRGESTSPPSPPRASTARVTRIGATARSWNSSTEKVARPAGECWRLCSARICMTTAVDDSDSAAPMAAAGAGASPMAMAAAAMTARQSVTCRAPMPNTQRRIRRRRSHDSSSPIMNRRKTTPNSASWAISAGLAMVK